MEFSAGTVLAILIAIIPLGFFLTVILAIFMAVIAVNFALRLHTPPRSSHLRKALRIILALALVGSITYKPLIDRYKEENEIPVVTQYIQSWGTPIYNGVSIPPPAKLVSGPGTLLLRVDGTRLSKFKDKYKLVGVISHSLSKNGDYMESSDICKSTPYTITDRILITIPLCQSYMDEIAEGAEVDNYWLLAIPIGFDQSNLTSLSAAIERRARIIGTATSKPASFHLKP